MHAINLNKNNMKNWLADQNRFTMMRRLATVQIAGSKSNFFPGIQSHCSLKARNHQEMQRIAFGMPSQRAQ